MCFVWLYGFFYVRRYPPRAARELQENKDPPQQSVHHLYCCSTPLTLPSITTFPLSSNSEIPVPSPLPPDSQLCNRSLLSFGLIDWSAVPTVICATSFVVPRPFSC